MKKALPYAEPLSTVLRRNPDEDKTEIINTVRWVALTTLFLLLALIPAYLLTGYSTQALVTSVAIVPVLVCMGLLKQESVSAPSTLLSVTIIILITLLATYGQGLYDIGLVGFPVILIVAGLILRGRMIMYLTLLVILCVGWLGFGQYFRWYTPVPIDWFNLHDIPVAIIIMLIAGNAVYRLSRNLHHNLARAKQEIAIREQAEMDREELIVRLKAKNQELDRFAVRVSHDLKTPLITLAGFLGYLERDLKDGKYEQAGKDFSLINAAAKTMGNFVDELLDLSRVGRITNPPTDVPFDEIVQDALKATDGLLKAKQVEVELDPIFPFVHVDHVRIVQVMQNLIANAVKFMGDQPNPRIKIGFDEIEGDRVFSVSDNGIGIASENHERIFELFSKLNPEAEGTGIGLGLVKKIIEVHHGQVWVESELGKGSTFKFTLKSSLENRELD